MTSNADAHEWGRVLANHDAAVQRVNDTLTTFREQLARAESRLAPKAVVRYADADVQLIVTATEQHCLSPGRPDADGHAPCSCGQWREGADGSSWDEHMAEVSLAALAAAGRLLPETTQTSVEWGVWWHATDPDGIVMTDDQHARREQAETAAKGRIGQYGITGYTLVKCAHRRYADGSTWTSAWDRVETVMP